MNLGELRPLVEIMAAERAPSGTASYDDAVQEGMIAAWQANELHPGKAPSYYRAAARNGVINVYRGRSPFGAASHRGRADAHDTSSPLVVTTEDGVEHFVVEPVVEEPAYDLINAPSPLLAFLTRTEAQLLYCRYWLDMPVTEVAETLGLHPSTVSSWTQGALQRLRAVLS